MSMDNGPVISEESMEKHKERGHMILAKMIMDAIEKYEQGKETDYYAIIEHISASQMKVVALQRWLQALCLCVSSFGKNHKQLVSSTLKLMWYNSDPETVGLYIEYMTCLLSAQTYYLRTVLSSLTKHLWVVPVDCDREKVLKNIHKAIESVLSLVPTASSVLLPLLNKNYPFKGKNAEIQEIALKNVLYITTYCPTLQEDIYELAIHQMLTIDVELPNLAEEEEGVSDGEGDDESTQFLVELDGQGKGALTGDESLFTRRYHSHKQVMSNREAEKLDVMMTVCLEHFHSICHDGEQVNVEAARNLLASLLKIFERVLLPTHACSCVQFLIFRHTTLDEHFPGLFLNLLWKKFQNPNTPAILRQAAAAYMASFIARAKFVSMDTAKLCLSVMAQWIHKHKSLLEMAGGIDFLRQLNFERIITSRLNPLKVCLPSVVNVFAKLANRCEIAFCYTIIEQNKRLILSSVGLPAASHSRKTEKDQVNYLDCFFPFDPFKLKRSIKFVLPYYQNWESIEEDFSDDEDNGDKTSLASSVTMSYEGSYLMPSCNSLPELN